MFVRSSEIWTMGCMARLHSMANPRILVTTKMRRNATPLKPLDRPSRSPAEIGRWRRERERWLGALAPAGLFHRLFDHVPGVYFFAKNREGRLMFASEGLRRRYAMRD